MVAMGTRLTGAEANLEACGFVGWLPKPVHRSRLLERLDDALNADARMPTMGDRTSVPPARRGKSGQEMAKLNGLQVLVAEDNETNQRVAAAHLLMLGYQSHMVPNGEAALKTLASPSHGFACVLMDGQMPILDGYEATRRQRAREEREGLTRIPIIALTANAMKGDRERALDAGMDAYLAKPFTLEQLSAALQEWCPAPESGGTLPPYEPSPRL